MKQIQQYLKINIFILGQLYGEEEEDSKLQRAIEEMRRLDKILNEKISREKEARRQRKELQARLWQELKVVSVLCLQYATTIVNATGLFPRVSFICLRVCFSSIGTYLLFVLQ